MGGIKKHVLDCDEYHAHVAPKCCSSDCWCTVDRAIVVGHAGEEDAIRAIQAIVDANPGIVDQTFNRVDGDRS